jgi:hypothetical protein
MKVIVSYLHNESFIILLYVNVIIVRINYLLVHVSSCIGHLQVTVKRNEIVVVCCTDMTAVLDVVCILNCVACSVSVFLGMCFFCFLFFVFLVM